MATASLSSFTRRRLLPLSTAIGFIVASQLAADGITIQIDYTYDTFFTAGSEKRDRLQEVASLYGNLFSDDLDAITPTGSFGAFIPESWQVIFQNPATGAAEAVDDLAVPADTIILYVGGRDLAGAQLAEAEPGGYNIFSFPGSTFDTAVTTRGESGVGTSDFAPWGGSLVVDDQSTWDTSLLGDGSSNQHLYTTLIHEVAHVFGMGTADSWYSQVNGSGEFTGSESVASFGGNVPLYQNPGNSMYDHWAENTTSLIYQTTTSQEASLDPDILAGTVKLLTELDVAGLDDIGWDISIAPVPEPSTTLLTLLLGATLCLRRRRR